MTSTWKKLVAALFAGTLLVAAPACDQDDNPIIEEEDEGIIESDNSDLEE